MPHKSHANYIKTTRIRFGDPHGNTMRQNKTDTLYLDLANPKALKNKLGGKPELEQYMGGQKQEQEISQQMT